MHDRVVRRAPPPSRRASRSAVIGGTIAALGAAALLNYMRTQRAEAANPPLGTLVEIDGVTLHYVERGPADSTARPVVLIHGNGSMVQDYLISGVVDRLAERRRVILIDRPGSGYSARPRDRTWGPGEQAALFVKLAERLGLDRPVVVGHSWGTLPAIAWALDHPERIGALVLASGYYFPTPRLDAVTVLPALIPGVGDAMRYTVSPIVGRLTIPLANRAIFSPAKTTAAWRAEFPLELALRPSQIRATLADTALMVPSAAVFEDRYKDLRLPLAMIAGDGDKLVSTRHQTKRLAGLLPHARLIVVEGAGHMVHHLDPAAFVAAVELAATASI